MDLPYEIVLSIGQYLWYDDVTALALTCSSYLPILTDDFFWKSKLQREYASSLLLVSGLSKNPDSISEFFLIRPTVTVPCLPREQYLFAFTLAQPAYHGDVLRIACGSQRYLGIDECLYRASNLGKSRLIRYFLSRRSPDQTASRLYDLAVKRCLEKGIYLSDFVDKSTLQDREILPSFLAGIPGEEMDIMASLKSLHSVDDIRDYSIVFKLGHSDLIESIDDRRSIMDGSYRRNLYRAIRYGHFFPCVMRFLDYVKTLPNTHDIYLQVLVSLVRHDSEMSRSLVHEFLLNNPDPLNKMMILRTLVMSGHFDWFHRICQQLSSSPLEVGLDALARSGNLALIQQYLRERQPSSDSVYPVMTSLIFNKRQVNRIGVYKCLFLYYEKRTVDESYILFGTVLKCLSNALRFRDIEVFNFVVHDSLHSDWRNSLSSKLNPYAETVRLLTWPDVLPLLLQYDSSEIVRNYMMLLHRHVSNTNLGDLRTNFRMCLRKNNPEIVGVFLQYHPELSVIGITEACRSNLKNMLNIFTSRFALDRLISPGDLEQIMVEISIEATDDTDYDTLIQYLEYLYSRNTPCDALALRRCLMQCQNVNPYIYAYLTRYHRRTVGQIMRHHKSRRDRENPGETENVGGSKKRQRIK